MTTNFLWWDIPRSPVRVWHGTVVFYFLFFVSVCMCEKGGGELYGKEFKMLLGVGVWDPRGEQMWFMCVNPFPILLLESYNDRFTLLPSLREHHSSSTANAKDRTVYH